jgi:hypothetical protein
MNAHERACRDAKVTLKAFQNLVGAHQGFEKLLTLGGSNDLTLLSAMFCFAVIKYARPFVETNTADGKVCFPARALKSTQGFVVSTHKHLLELRNRLIAHDDLDSIEPRILSLFMNVGTPPIASIPVSIVASNMCLAVPADLSSLENLRDHVAACVRGAHGKLQADLERIHQAALDNPAEAMTGAKYQKDYGQATPVDGTRFRPPDMLRDEWLDLGPPSFSHAQAGSFHYETLRVRRDFYGPQTITLPGGELVQIVPGHPPGDKPA